MVKLCRRSSRPVLVIAAVAAAFVLPRCTTTSTTESTAEEARNSDEVEMEAYVSCLRAEKRLNGSITSDGYDYCRPELREPALDSLFVGVTPREIDATIDINNDAVDACYKKTLKKNPKARGTVVMSWTINPSGDTSNAKIESSDIKDPDLQSCLTKAITGLSFPRPRLGKTKNVTNYAFDLRPPQKA